MFVRMMTLEMLFLIYCYYRKPVCFMCTPCLRKCPTFGLV